MRAAPIWLLAWRNVWRNSRRTAITVATIGAGLAALLFGQSLVETIQAQLIEKATGVYVGHLQVVGTGVDDYKFPNVWIDKPGEILEAAAGLAEVEDVSARIVATGLASSQTESAGVLILGVDPEKERQMMTMSSYIKQGNFLADGGDGIVLGKKLAAQLGVALGGEVVLMSSAIDGSMGAELFPVVGIYDSGSHTFDASIAYVPLASAQRLLSAGEQVNDFVVRIKKPARIREAQSALSAVMPQKALEVVTWEEVDPELVGIRDYQSALLSVILLVIFVIVALGILNTLLMAMFERIREFGVLTALGANAATIRALVLTEAVLLGAIGALAGGGLGAGLILYFGSAGLNLPLGDAVGYFMPFDSVLFLRFDWSEHAKAIGAVFLTSAASGIIPALRASSLRPVEALRHL